MYSFLYWMGFVISLLLSVTCLEVSEVIRHSKHKLTLLEILTYLLGLSLLIVAIKVLFLLTTGAS